MYGCVVGLDASVELVVYSMDRLVGDRERTCGWNCSSCLTPASRKYHLVDSDGKLWGDTKAVTFTNGTKTSVRILGFRHDELAGGGRAGISFEFADAPWKHRMNAEDTNEGGWESSEMRAWLNLDFFVLLPEDLRVCVKPVTKRTNNVGKVKNKIDTTVVTKTSDHLWLLASREIHGKTSGKDSDIYNAEGIQYQLYADQGADLSNDGFCKKDGVVSWWYLRSPSAHNENGFCSVDIGAWYHLAGYDGGVSPGFCL